MEDRAWDLPRTLRDPAARERKRRLLGKPRVAPLTDFVRSLREEVPGHVPYFDPDDGGVEDRVLFLFEAPGPSTGNEGSGFISRDNDDPSAANFFRYNHEAGLERKKTISWNTVPWFVAGPDGRFRKPTDDEVRQAEPATVRLLDLLPHVEVIVLCGLVAHKAENLIRREHHTARIFPTYHPSPTGMNRYPKNKAHLMNTLREIAELVGRSGIPPQGRDPKPHP